MDELYHNISWLVFIMAVDIPNICSVLSTSIHKIKGSKRDATLSHERLWISLALIGSSNCRVKILVFTLKI